MNRKIMRGLLVFTVILLLSGCGQSRALTAQGTTLRAAVRLGGEPYSYRSSNGFSGSEIDLINSFAEAQGLTTEWIPVRDEELASVLDQGRADLAVGRIEGSDFDAVTIPYTSDGLYVLSRSGEMYGTPGALAQKRLGTLAGQEADAVLAGLFPDNSPAPMTDHDAVSSALLNNTLDAVICYDWQATELVEDTDGQIRCEPLTGADPVACRIAVSPERPALTEALNQFLSAQAAAQQSEASEPPPDGNV